MATDKQPHGWCEVNIIRDEEREELAKAAKEDGIEIIADLPTHIIRRNGDIVGYFSITMIPYFHFWLHRTKIQPRESFELIFNAGLNIARGLGWKYCFTPCSDKSPFYSLLENMGTQNLGQVDFLFKQL